MPQQREHQESHARELAQARQELTVLRHARSDAVAARAAQRDAEQRLHDLLNETTDGYMVVDAQWRVTAYNRKPSLGPPPSEPPIGRSLWDFIPDTERNAPMRTALQRVMRERTSHRFEAPLESRGVWIEGDIYPSGEGLVIIYRDITTRKQAQEQLQQREELFRLLMENAVDIVYRYRLTNPPGYEYISLACQRITGYSPEEFYNSPTGGIEFIHPDDRASLAKLRDDAKDPSIRPTLRYLAKDGRSVWVELTRTPVYGPDGSLVAIEGIARDITERKKAEEALRRSEERFRLLAENARDIVFRFRYAEPRGLEYISPAIERVLGYTPEEMLADPSMGYRTVHPEDRHLVDDIRSKRRQAGSDAADSSLTDSVVMRWIAKDGRVVWIESTRHVIQDEPGRVIAIEGIARDVTERKKAEQTLAESEQRFRLLAENAQDVVYRYRLLPTFQIEYMSPSSVSAVGYSPADYYRDPSLAAKVMHPDDQEAMRSFLTDPRKSRAQSTFRFLHRDGSVRWFELRRLVTLDEQGRVAVVQGIARDVTATKEAEERLRQSEERFRLLAESAQDIIYRYRLIEPRGFEYVSPAAQRVLGYSPEEFKNDPDMGSKLVHPDDREMNTRFQSRPDGAPIAVRWVAKDGRVVWVELVRRTVLDAQGRRIAVEGIARDISERKRAEEALRAGEERFRLLAENAHDIVYQYRLTEPRGFEYVSPSVFKLTGYTPEELYTDPEIGVRLVHPQDQDIRQAVLDRPEDFIRPYAIRWVTKDGRTIWIEHVRRIVRDAQGRAVAVHGISRDITERKQAEEALRASEERFRLLAENAQDIVYRYRLAEPRGFEYVSPSCQKILGYMPEELGPTAAPRVTLLHPDDRAFGDQIRANPDQFTSPYAVRWMAKDGGVRWLEHLHKVVRDNQGNIVALNGIARDITEQKRAERAFKDLNRLLLDTLENSQDAFFSVDSQWRITYFNRKAEEYTQRTRGDVLGKPLWDTFDLKSGADKTFELLQTAMLERKAVHLELYYAPFDAWVEVNAYPTADGLAFFYRDISQRRKTEAALRESEERFRLLTENARDMIYLFRFQPQRRFEYVSPASIEITGHTPEEFYMNPDLFLSGVHPDDREATRAALESPAKSVIPIVSRWVDKDGAIRWLESRRAPVFDEQGTLVAVEAITRDITERRRAEEELLQTNRRLQTSGRRVVKAQEDIRRMVAERLHGQVQNRLVVASQHVKLAQEAVTSAPLEAAGHLSQAASIIGTVVQEDLRTITRQLHPSMIRHGLLPSLRSLADSFEHLEVDIQFYALSPEMRAISGAGLDEGLRLSIFRVAEEALNNVQKHAQTHRVELVIDTPSKDSISLTIRDQGKGFDPAVTPAGLGIFSMQDYCAAQGGEVRVESAPGKGTAVIASFPIQWKTPPAFPSAAPPCTSELQASGKTKRLLIADDMSEFCALLRETFTPAEGFEVVGEAYDGQEAVELAQKLDPRPDVVILDIEMPKLTGPEAAAAIRTRLPAAAIFLVSAYDQAEYSEVAKNVGAAGYIPKKSLTPARVLELLGEAAPSSDVRA